MNIERISYFINSQGLKTSVFERTIGISNGAIRKAIKNSTDIQSKWITSILDNYPNLSAEWLLTGKGEMLKTGPGASNTEPPQVANDPKCAYTKPTVGGGNEKLSYISRNVFEDLLKNISSLNRKIGALEYRIGTYQKQTGED